MRNCLSQFKVHMFDRYAIENKIETIDEYNR